MFDKLLGRHREQLSLFQCFLFFVAITVTFAIASPFFLTSENFSNILTASSVLGLMALGSTFVIASGGIDLSTAAVMALAGVFCAWTVQEYHAGPGVALFAAAGVGAIVGLITGALVVVTRAPSFIVTLGMLSIARALAFIFTGGVPLYGLDDNVTAVAQAGILGFTYPVLFLIGFSVFTALLLSWTRFGTHVLTYGDNKGAARALGINCDALQLKVFTLAGVCSGVAGFIFTIRTNSGDPSAGQNYELMAITAVILGGANLFGGKATILGTFLGVLCLGILQNGLNLLAISTFYQILFVGCILLAAALLRRFGEEQWSR